MVLFVCFDWSSQWWDASLHIAMRFGREETGDEHRDEDEWNDNVCSVPSSLLSLSDPSCPFITFLVSSSSIDWPG